MDIMMGRLGTCMISILPWVDERSYVYSLIPLPGVGISVIQSRNPKGFHIWVVGIYHTMITLTLTLTRTQSILCNELHIMTHRTCVTRDRSVFARCTYMTLRNWLVFVVPFPHSHVFATGYRIVRNKSAAVASYLLSRRIFYRCSCGYWVS